MHGTGLRRKSRAHPSQGKGPRADLVPIFDSLTHPTITGAWMTREGKRADASTLIRDMDASNVRWALAVGMAGIGGYDEEAFAEHMRQADSRFIPVAYVDPASIDSPGRIPERMSRIAGLGYAGIKIHPRLAGITLGHPLLPSIVKAAHDSGLFTLLCTYPYHRKMTSEDYGLEHLAVLLDNIGQSRIVLLHGGCVRLLEVIEIARSFDNALVDVSFTLCKYEGSSLDLDLAYAFRRFDKRLCIGSDFPDFTPTDMRKRFVTLTQGIAVEKVENVAYRNLLRFVGKDDHETL